MKEDGKEEVKNESILGGNLTVSTQNLIIDKTTTDTSTDNLVENTKKPKSPSKKKRNKRAKIQGNVYR